MTETLSSDSAFDREKWEADVRLREREIAVKEHEQDTNKLDVQAKLEELRRSRWTNPLVLAVLAATFAAAGNAAVALINGVLQRSLEESRATAQVELESKKALAEQKIEEAKAEAARILEVIKTNNPDTAAVNLSFLLETGLIVNQERRASLAAFLKSRAPGQGPALPAREENSPRRGPLTYKCPIKEGRSASFVKDELESFLKSKGSSKFQVIHNGDMGANTAGIWIKSSNTDEGFLIEVTAPNSGLVTTKFYGDPSTRSDEQILADQSAAKFSELALALLRIKLRELSTSSSCAT